LKVLELFCGTKSFTKVAEARGHECRTLDIDKRFDPTYCMDIMDFEPTILNGWHPDVIWASPPCTAYSVAAIGKNWRKSGPLFIPISDGAKNSKNLVLRTQSVIRRLNPAYYFIENPRGMLRMMNFMRGWNRSTVTYCQYGAQTQKPTDIWNNCLDWTPKPMCRPKAPCHIAAPRGSKRGIQGIMVNGWHNQRKGWSGATAIARGIVPPQLCEEILIACESRSGKVSPDEK